MKRFKILAVLIALSLFFSYNLCAKEQKIKGQAKVNYRSANLYLAEKKADKALGFYEKVIVEYPDHVMSLYNIGSIYYNKAVEDRQDIVANLKKADVYFSKTIQVLTNLPDIDQYDGFVKLKKETETLRKSIWVKLFNEATNNLNTEGELNQAETLFNDLLVMTPDSLNLYFRLAMVYEKKNDPVKQKEFFNKILEKDPNNIRVLSVLAYEAYNAQDYAKAAELYSKLAVAEPENIEHLLTAASCYYNLKDVTKALEYYEKALVINPNNTDALANCATIAQTSNQDAKALGFMKKLVEVESSEENLSVISYHLLKMQDWKELLKYSQQWYEMNKQKKEAVQLIVMAASKLNNKELQTKYSNILKNMQ